MIASKIKWASIKSPERSFEKVNRSYGNYVSCLVAIRVLQCVAVWCVAVCCRVLFRDGLSLIWQRCVMPGGELCVTVCCSVLHCSVLQRVAVSSFGTVCRSYVNDMLRLVTILQSQLATQLT